jgi:hypothetical protein
MTLPDTLTAERHRDLAGRNRHARARRILLLVVALVPLLALLNFFGQRPGSKIVASPSASLKLYVPDRLRSGLIYEARFHIRAAEQLDHAALVLSPGWLEGTTLNTIEPSPANETSQDGRLRLELGKIDAGRSFLLFLQLQVNPTNVGRRSTDVALYDGSTRILTVHRTVTIFP